MKKHIDRDNSRRQELSNLRRRIRMLLTFFIIALSLSGLTAFPLEMELRLGHEWFQTHQAEAELTGWIGRVYHGVAETNRQFPFIAYGTDWLAFAHLILAVAFFGPLRDPVRNIWVVEFGLIASIAVIPMAWVAGEIRGIPPYWRLIDSMFGVIGGLVLWRCHSAIRILEHRENC